MSDSWRGRSLVADPVVGEVGAREGTGSDEHTVAAEAAQDPARPGRRWRPGVTTGVLAAAPSTAAATGSALLAACGSCLGAGSAVAVSAAASATGGAAAGATTGVAASGGMPLWQIVFTAALIAVLAGLQLRRALVAARVRGGSRGRAGFVLRQMAPSLLTAAVAFAAVQLLVVPWLSAPPAPGVPTLP
jgi:hypothetical protein